MRRAGNKRYIKIDGKERFRQVYGGPNLVPAYDPTRRSELLTKPQVAEAQLAHRYCTLLLGYGAPCDDRLELIVTTDAPHLWCNTHRWVSWDNTSPISDRHG